MCRGTLAFLPRPGSFRQLGPFLILLFQVCARDPNFAGLLPDEQVPKSMQCSAGSLMQDRECSDVSCLHAQSPELAPKSHVMGQKGPR